MSSRSIPSVLSGSQPVDPTAKPHKASFDTTAALAQKEATTPNEARIVNRNASEERDAAEKAAQVAREHGEDFTGKPEGDTNTEAVRESLTHLHGGVKFDQIYGSGDTRGSESMAGKATGVAKGASSKITDTAKGAGQQASQSAQGALNAASNKASGAAETVSSTASDAYNAAANTASQAYSTVAGTAKTASNKASETADSATKSASRAAGATSQKASEAYNAGASTASSAANTASNRASQAAGGASEMGVGILGTMQHTAASAMHTATDTASSVLSAAQQFVGMGTSGQDEAAAANGGLQKGATKESGKDVPTKRAGGDAHVTDTAPSETGANRGYDGAALFWGLTVILPFSDSPNNPHCLPLHLLVASLNMSSEGGFGSFIGGLAQAALKEATGSNSDVNKTGGAELNSPHHSGQHSSSSPSFDQDEVVKTASHHGSGESSLFSTALSFISKNKDKEEEPIDEEEATKAHEKVYQKNDASGLSASALGSAAALQVLQQFVGGKSSSGSSSHGTGSQSGGTTQLISLAMAEATKLFDKSGGKVNGDKQDAVNGAAMTIMKLVVQSKFGRSGTTGGKDSGGLSGLLGLASQFAK